MTLFLFSYSIQLFLIIGILSNSTMFLKIWLYFVLNVLLRSSYFYGSRRITKLGHTRSRRTDYNLPRVDDHRARNEVGGSENDVVEAEEPDEVIGIAPGKKWVYLSTKTAETISRTWSSMRPNSWPWMTSTFASMFKKLLLWANHRIFEWKSYS